MAARRYRMTPRRRAALAKAREASARKRRRSRNRRIAVGAVTVVSLAGASYSAGKYYKQGAALAGMAPSRPSSFYSRSKEVDVVRVTLRADKGGKLNFSSAGKPWNKTSVKRKIKRPRAVKRAQYHVFKVDSAGKARSTTTTRILYDRQRRAGIVSGYERKPRPKKYNKKRR